MKALLHNLESFILIFFSAEPEHRKIFPRQLGFCTAGRNFITDFYMRINKLYNYSPNDRRHERILPTVQEKSGKEN